MVWQVSPLPDIAKSGQVGVMVLTVTGTGVILSPLFAVTGGRFFLTAIVFAVVLCMVPPISLLLDSWIVHTARQNTAINYGVIRFFGFDDVVTGLVSGWLIELYVIRTMHVVISVVVLLPTLGYCCLFIAPHRRARCRN